uniref:Uncharacterized protein n=1 Tax=Vibrio parahaemolyticus TaxID=670 RepID=A0A5P5X5F1_VIBPH|nr:hypothetical protein [Vibrio parahaemolyticus]
MRRESCLGLIFVLNQNASSTALFPVTSEFTQTFTFFTQCIRSGVLF